LDDGWLVGWVMNGKVVGLWMVGLLDDELLGGWMMDGWLVG